ncbi:hypothetical protein, partial [Thalassolituus alkanivorans]
FAGMARSYDLLRQAWSACDLSRQNAAPTICFSRHGPLLRFIAAKCRSYDLFQRFAGMARSYNLLRLITDF